MDFLVDLDDFVVLIDLEAECLIDRSVVLVGLLDLGF